ncbi:MAG: hypothetical protein KDB86_10260 [Actinobacteria bacterium]|nr:hypothetical protein [Actinomycetota bacterium]MCB9389807.1 hypothetical protein [Acidimicrobiia bacterium]
MNNLRFVALWGAAAILALVAAHVGFDAAASKVVASPPPDVGQVLAEGSQETATASPADVVPRANDEPVVPDTAFSATTGNASDPVINYTPTSAPSDSLPPASQDAGSGTVPNTGLGTQNTVTPGPVLIPQIPAGVDIPTISVPPATAQEAVSRGSTATTTPAASATTKPSTPRSSVTTAPTVITSPTAPVVSPPSTRPTATTAAPGATGSTTATTPASTTPQATTQPSSSSTTTQPPNPGDVDVVSVEVPEAEGTNIAVTSSSGTGLLTVLLTQKNGERIGIADIQRTESNLIIIDVNQNRYIVGYQWDMTAGVLRITGVQFIPAPATPQSEEATNVE